MAGPTHIAKARAVIEAGLTIGPRMYPCVCGAGRHAHKGAQGTGACKETGCRRYRANLAYELAYDALDAQATKLGAALRRADRVLGEKRRAANPVLPGQWRIGASDSDTCRRVIFYRNLPPEGLVRAPEDKREALMGTIIHEGAEARLRMLYPWREFEQNVTIPGLDRESRIDWYDGITAEVGDVKTAGDWRWDKLGEHGPEEGTWDQVFLYALAIEEAGRPVKTVRLQYLKRANGHDEEFVRPYDRARAEKARDRLMGYAEALDLLAEDPERSEATVDALFPRDGAGPDRDALCRRCTFRIDCWNMPAAEALGRSPCSYTVLGSNPEDAEVEWAIHQHVEANTEIRAAKARADEAKDLLDGVEPRRYGMYQGAERGRDNGDDHAAYAARLVELYALPDGMRPPIEDVPVPKKKRSHWIQWGRVRKATLEKEQRDAARLDRSGENGAVA